MAEIRLHKHAGASARCNAAQEEAILALVEAGRLIGPDVDVYYEPGTRPAVLAEGRGGQRYLVFDDGTARPYR